MNPSKILLLFFLLIMNVESIGQDKIEFTGEKVFKYKYQGVGYKKSQLPQLLKANKEAYKMLQKSNQLKTLSIVCGASSFLFIFAILNNSGGDGSGGYLLSSLISGTVGILTYKVSKYRRTKAIIIFNDGVKLTPDLGMTPIEMNFGLMTNGMGVSINF